MTKGFTLIELMVVVLIIGILSSIALPQYTVAVEKARAAEMVTNVRNIIQGDQMWRLVHRNEKYATWKDVYTIPGATCSGTSCQTKDFTYDLDGFAMDGSGTGVVANGDRLADGENFYEWDIMRNADRTYTKTCYANGTRVGRAVCRSLEGQGWVYSEGGQ